jgi:hypothetical protein
MSREEAEELIIQKEGRLCVRFFRRYDGTLMTRDCPIGLRALRRPLRILFGLAAMILVLAFGLTASSGSGRIRNSPITRTEPIRTFLDWIDPDGKLPGNRPCVLGKM